VSAMKTLLLAAVAAVALVACDESPIAVQPGAQTTVRRVVSGYSALDVARSCNVDVRFGTNDTIVIEGPEGFMPYVRTFVENGTLRVDIDPAVSNVSEWRSNRISITVPTLTRVELSGASSCTFLDTLAASGLICGASGASRLDLKAVLAGECKLALSGASVCTIVGRADGHTADDISGASRLEAFGFPCPRVRIDASGASTLNVNALETLNVDASGGSTIRYRGRPAITSDLSGGSVVIDAN
jgi:hypothetical protein